jgi:UDP-2,3-diacylglucosamine pyrophosphatase LpxH
MRRLGLVVSDLHLGTGHKRGRINIYDDFKEDDRLSQLLARYSTGAHSEHSTHLILNGDIFDLLKVPVLGRFPDAISERLAKIKLYRCIRGHPTVIAALARFLDNPNNVITYQPGNHDMEFHFPGVQRLFCRAVTGADEHERVRFSTTASYFTLDGVQFHHGHQFEALHAMDWQRLLLSPPGRDPILNLPWGSLFILHVVNELVRERPYLDKVHPFWPLFVGGMFLDAAFTTKMVGISVAALVQARFNPAWWQKRPFEKLSKFLRNDVGFFEHLDRYADKLMKADPQIHAVIMGHTHVPMLRTFPGGRVYVNTGTWIPMVDLGLGRLGQRLELHYAAIEWTHSGPPLVSLRRWHGQRAESEEVIA